jgi:hypothetical protein
LNEVCFECAFLANCHAMLHFLAAPCSQEAGHLWQEQEEEEEEEEEE